MIKSVITLATLFLTSMASAQTTPDIKHIALDLSFDWATKTASGTANITLKPGVATDVIALDAGMLTIQSVTVNGKATAFTYDGGDNNDGLKIDLDRKYRPDENLTIAIAYHTNYINDTDPNNIWGSNGKGLRFFSPSDTDPGRHQQLWSFGDPEGNKYWFPCNEAPNDLYTSEIKATVPNPLMVISNGSLVGATQNKDNTTTFHWKTDTPHTLSRTLIVAGQYVVNSQFYQDIQLDSYGYPNEVQATEDSTVRLADMMRFFSEKTGVKYPYNQYSQVFVQELPGFLTGAATSVITENMVDDYGTHADYFYLWDLTEAEALARQWFGNTIPAASWRDGWLTQSLAHYLSGLYDEHRNGRDEFHLYVVNFDQNTYLNDWKSDVRRAIVTDEFTDATTLLGDNYATARGALVLHMLRHEMGDEKWWQAVSELAKTYVWKPVATEDFERICEKVAGRPMDWFFRQWLYKAGHPVFNIEKKYDRKNQILTLTVKQTQQKSTPLDQDYFEGNIAIEIDGDIQTIRIAATPENTFSFPLPSVPKLVHFDYGNIWIKEVTFEKTLAEWLYQFDNSTDIMARNEALFELVTIVKDPKTTDSDATKILKSLRGVIAGDSYWRLRFIALQQLQGIMTGNNKPVKLDQATLTMLQLVMGHDMPWMKTAAITFLGQTRNPEYDEIYLAQLHDESDRVVNAAAVALGRSKSRKAFDALVALKNRPSWKSQSLISALNGLQQLGDARAYEFAFDAFRDKSLPHWTLAVPTWDYRLAAADVLQSLGKTDAAYDVVFERFQKSIEARNTNDIFYNTQLMMRLGNPRGAAFFPILKARFANDANAMQAISQLEQSFNTKP
ncbi:Aminopeptidase N [Flavobacterium longum]|uniref:M1 family aminopeptidase n=1 Tax=Flavobacterium longum TaxID=1299340 RepID=UPI0039EC2DA4